jgi:NAD dependent epimerase/dehydratase family enzyme
VCRAIRFLIETSSAKGVFNLCSPQPLTNVEFGRALAHSIRRPSWLPIPALVYKVAFGEAATVLLDGQKTYPQRLLNLGFEFQYPEIGAALANLSKSAVKPPPSGVGRGRKAQALTVYRAWLYNRTHERQK